MTWRQVVVAAVVLGCVAAGVVWWLERFELEKMYGEIGNYIGKREEFNRWMKERGIDGDD